MMLTVTNDDEPVLPAPRPHYDRATRIALAQQALPALEGGEPPEEEIQRLMLAADRSRRSVLRMIKEARDAAKTARTAANAHETAEPDLLPREFLRECARSQGNVAQAIATFWPDGAPWHPATIYRKLDQIEPGLKLCFRSGPDAFERVMATGVYESPYRNALWLVDEVHIPYLSRDKHGRVIDNLWAIIYFDAWSRLVTSAATNVGAITAKIAAATYLRAVTGWEAEGVRVAGCPDLLISDHAKCYKAEQFGRAVATSGARHEFAHQHDPLGKAKLERFNWTLVQTYLQGIGWGYVDGPPRVVVEERMRPNGKIERVRIERPMFVPAKGKQLLRVEAVQEAVAAAIEDYNLRRVHSVTGSTPIGRYGTGTNLQRVIGPAAMYPYAHVVSRPHEIATRGIWYDHAWRTAPEIETEIRPAATGKRSGHVEVRVLPGFPADVVLVGEYVDEKRTRFLARVEPEKTEDEKNARLQRDGSRRGFIREITLEAQAEAEAEATGSAVDEPVATRPARQSARREAKRAATSLANRDALRALPIAGVDVA